MSIFKKTISVMLCLVMVISNMVFYPLSYAVYEKSIANDRINFNAKPNSDKQIIKAKALKQDADEHTRFIIKYKSDTSDKEKNRKNNEVQTKLKLSRLNSIKKISGGIEVFEISEKGRLSDVIDELASSEIVEYIQPDYKLFSLESSPQPQKPEEHLEDSNQPAEQEQQSGELLKESVEDLQETRLFEPMAGNGLDIGMEDVFGYIQGMPYILVGILDTGIDITHDELNCSIFSNDKEIHANNIDDDGNGYIDDTNGWDFYNKTPLADFESGNNSHGTHIAGIISAKADNSGIMGIAPGVVILPLKFMQGDFGYTSDAIEAIHYAEAMGASILNCSWGSKYSNYALYEAISNSNMLFVSAAGNSSSKEAVYPAAYDLPNVISVGSVNSRGELSSISNYGPKVDIFAEGENILSTLPSNTYGEMSGTSISTAFVAAAAALVKAYNYTACAEELKYRLKTYTTPNTFDQSYETSAGILNVLAAMTGDTYDFTPSKPRENKQLEYLTQYIIQNYNTFSSIETKHKNEFLARTRLKEEDFLLCESLGLSLADSFSIIKSISKNSVLSIADALALYKLKHKDMESYINEVARFNIFTFRYLGSKDTDFYVEALLKYGNANAIRAAYVVSKSLDIAFEEVYSDKKEVIVKDMVDRSLKLTGEDINILNEMLELFPVNGARILEYIKSSGRKPNEIYEAVKEFEMDIAEKNGEILRPLSSQAPSFDKYSYAPFTYTKEKNETINTSSGSLRITDNILTLKGRNGMDLDLSLVYDSSMSNLYEPGYYAVTDYSYVIWLTYKVNVLSISGTTYYTYDNLGWVYDSTYYNYQNAL